MLVNTEWSFRKLVGLRRHRTIQSWDGSTNAVVQANGCGVLLDPGPGTAAASKEAPPEPKKSTLFSGPDWLINYGEIFLALLIATGKVHGT